jgi:hypothetical protein
MSSELAYEQPTMVKLGVKFRLPIMVILCVSAENYIKARSPLTRKLCACPDSGVFETVMYAVLCGGQLAWLMETSVRAPAGVVVKRCP